MGPKSKVRYRVVKTGPNVWLLITLKAGGFDQVKDFPLKFQVKAGKE